MKTILTIASIVLLGIGLEPKWQLEKEKDGIKVYTANSDSTSFKQFKVEAEIEGTPKEIADAVIDLENNFKWFFGVKKGEMLEEKNKYEFTFKQVIEVPFPFQDREVVQHCTVKFLTNGDVRIDLIHRNSAAPVNEDYVRMPYSKGYWILKPAGNKTKIEYSFLADPGGNIPAWLANQFIVESPFKTIKGLREYLKNK